MQEPYTKEQEQEYEKCKLLLPKRYTSDPDVLNNPEEMKKVEAEWAAYFACIKAAVAKTEGLNTTDRKYVE
jgi:hypothetical protein